MPAVLPNCQRFQLHLPVRNVALREITPERLAVGS
jgi:hypothetical protein